MLHFWAIELTALVNHNNYEILLDKILGLDPKIRYVVIFDGKIHSKFKEGIVGFYKQKEIESSLTEARNRWGLKEKIRFKIGEPRFSMAEYGKTNRITFPLSNDAVLLLSTDLDVYVNQLVDTILKMHHELKYNISGFSRR